MNYNRLNFDGYSDDDPDSVFSLNSLFAIAIVIQSQE